ncbi:MAG: hypothetical protein ACUVRV_07750 [Cyanobacteriota bacterium]
MGKGSLPPDNWCYPGFCRYGIVLLQPKAQLVVYQVQEAFPEQPQGVDLNPNLDTAFNINDAKGSYGDNSGSFDVYLQGVS